MRLSYSVHSSTGPSTASFRTPYRRRRTSTGSRRFHSARCGPGARASTAAAAVHILEHYGVTIKGAEAVIVGRSTVVGKPAAALLLNRHATVTLCHTRTRDLADVCKRADIVIAAAGSAGLVTGDMVKPGAAVIDCGYNYLDDGTVVGDAVFDEVAEVAALTNKAAGGVGPVTTAMLLKHVAEAAFPAGV
jgi:methylenetetrahydrofolate dehydrogenase (NADP+)/methenyltetrahydrofolate cyclohydrolase